MNTKEVLNILKSADFKLKGNNTEDWDFDIEYTNPLELYPKSQDRLDGMVKVLKSKGIKFDAPGRTITVYVNESVDSMIDAVLEGNDPNSLLGNRVTEAPDDDSAIEIVQWYKSKFPDEPIKSIGDAKKVLAEYEKAHSRVDLHNSILDNILKQSNESVDSMIDNYLENGDMSLEAAQTSVRGYRSAPSHKSISDDEVGEYFTSEKYIKNGAPYEYYIYVGNDKDGKGHIFVDPDDNQPLYLKEIDPNTDFRITYPKDRESQKVAARWRDKVVAKTVKDGLYIKLGGAAIPGRGQRPMDDIRIAHANIFTEDGHYYVIAVYGSPNRHGDLLPEGNLTLDLGKFGEFKTGDILDSSMIDVEQEDRKYLTFWVLQVLNKKIQGFNFETGDWD